MSKLTEAMAWFKDTFRDKVNPALAGTPFNQSLITAIAVQETGHIWRGLTKTLTPDEILKVCVGDTLDHPKRSAFPKNKAALLAEPKGKEMFAIARQALLDVAKHDKSMDKVAKNFPDKFCHGYGMLQYDLQFFKTDPDFFLKKRWENFDNVIAHGVGELSAAQKRIKLHTKPALTDDELIHVAIAYNRGTYDPAKGLKQGFKDSDGVFYGERINDYYKTAKTVP